MAVAARAAAGERGGGDRPAGTLGPLPIGRVSVDLYPEQSGVALADVRSFAKSLGGSATNVAVAAARLGARAAVVTKVGDDPFGPYVRSALEGFGVDARWVGTHPSLRTPVVFCEIFPPDDFPLLFYREPTAPDMMLEAEELDLDAIRAARVFWTTGTGLSAEPSRTATLTALAARDGGGGITVHDLDHRPMFWPHEEEAGRWAREALAHATVAVEVPPVPVEVVNGLGAGDAFGGALVHGLLAGWPLERTIALANAAGSYVAGQLACADAMPTLDELEAFAPPT